MATLEITTKIGCKNMCTYCPQELLIERYKQPYLCCGQFPTMMSLNDFKKMIDKVPSDVRIDFSGMCEPWLNPNCTDMLLYAFESGHMLITVYTTAVGMSKKDIVRIKDIPFLDFALHLPDNDYNTKIKVTNEYLEIIRLIYDSNISSLKTSSMDQAHPAFNKMIQSYFNRTGIRHSIITMNSRGGNVDDMQPYSTFTESIDNTEYCHKGQIRCKCLDPLKHNVLLPDGTVVACCQDYGMDHVFGNLLDQTYESLFAGDEFMKLQKMLLEESAEKCLCRTCCNAEQI